MFHPSPILAEEHKPVIRVRRQAEEPSIPTKRVDGAQPPGSYRLVWDGRNDRGQAVASGVYLYRLKTPQFRHTRKMLLLR